MVSLFLFCFCCCKRSFLRVFVVGLQPSRWLNQMNTPSWSASVKSQRHGQRHKSSNNNNKTFFFILKIFSAYLCHIYSCHDRQHVIAAFSRTSFPHTFSRLFRNDYKTRKNNNKQSCRNEFKLKRNHGWRLAAATRNIEHNKKKKTRSKGKDRASCSSMPHVACRRRQKNQKQREASHNWRQEKKNMGRLFARASGCLTKGIRVLALLRARQRCYGPYKIRKQKNCNMEKSLT